jgi:lycopene cyclase domain-containing protein
MQYTLLSLLALLLALASAIYLKLPAKPLLLLCFLSIFFQLIFDNIMTWAGLWEFDFSQTLGLSLPFIPLENLLFGLALALFMVAGWEKAKG